MKYLAIFLIIIMISAQSANVYPTVVHVQSSKGKQIKSSKAKSVKTLSRCPLKHEKSTNSIRSAAAAKIEPNQGVKR